MQPEVEIELAKLATEEDLLAAEFARYPVVLPAILLGLSVWISPVTNGLSLLFALQNTLDIARARHRRRQITTRLNTIAERRRELTQE
ncbi:MAG: hypothetical protein R3C31_09360 [Hyphomonadaceae bacterium]